MTRKQISIEEKWRDTLPELNEKQKRYYAAREAKAYGFGGVTAFSRATGMNRDTINQGIKELESGNTLQGNRIRRPGGGRKTLEQHQPGLTETIETTRSFVDRYKVSEQDFLDLILSGEATPEILATKFKCSLLEASGSSW